MKKILKEYLAGSDEKNILRMNTERFAEQFLLLSSCILIFNIQKKDILMT